MRGPSTEDAFPERLGGREPLESCGVRIADDLDQLRSHSRHLVLCRDSEEGRERDEIRDFVPLRESANIPLTE